MIIGYKFYKFMLNMLYPFVKRARGLPWDPLICIDLSCQGGMPWGDFFILGYMKTAKGLASPLATPGLGV